VKKPPKIKTFGFLNVDKPSGLLSSAVVNKIKWLTGLPSGHLGTLDPLASGVLPVGVGNATRLFDYFLNKEKEYIAEFTFGVSSDTLDSTGALTYGGKIPSEQEIERALPELLGEVWQIPPKYSAKSVGGKRGYDLARAGVEFELAPKKVRIYEMQFLGKSETTENAYKIRIVCGGGTYIRSIGRDLAEKLGTNAVMSYLRRTKSGAFYVENAVPFSVLENDPPLEELEKYILPTESVLPFERLELTSPNWEKIFNGVKVKCDREDGEYKFYNLDGSFYGIAEVKEGQAKLKTKLC